MSKITQVVRAHAGIAAASAVLVLGGAGAATAAVVTTSSSDAIDTPADTADNPAVAPSAEVTSAAPSTTVAVAPPVVAAVPDPAIDTPAPAPRAATVPVVTSAPNVESQPVNAAPVEEAAPSSYDPMATWVNPVTGATYVPAPDPEIEKLPGEPGYVPPAD